ncbi:MAG: 1-acyl-sn-glycerol-3-phosphate acyltransferase, partial [Myxococcota bacterium]
MLDLNRMGRIKLSAKPRLQRVVGVLGLTPNYKLPPRVKIDFEGYESVPDEPVIFAMNHTDRFNYWPFQYSIWRKSDRYTATWVKGKYYESNFVGKFMEWTNNIPTVSRGYLITRDMLLVLKRTPTNEEYAWLRQEVDAGVGLAEANTSSVPPALAPLLNTPRSMLGHPFDPATASYGEAVNTLFRAMMGRFVALNAEAFDLGLDMLVFPQGTRSIRLSKGHIGLAQIALKYGKTIVPVGCNGSDKCYPRSSPFAKGGHITYRFGAPITPEEMEPFATNASFEPFTAAAETAHRDAFQGLVD